jgi:hypothetical protein
LLVPDERRQVVAVELRNVGRRVFEASSGVETLLVAIGEKLLLYSREGASGSRRCFVDAVRVGLPVRKLSVGGPDSNCADAVRAELQEKPEIVLVGGSTGSCLEPAKPTLRAEMLEERVEAAAPVMVANVGR